MLTILMMMTDKIFLIVKLIVRTNHKHINEAIRELEQETTLIIPDTKNVRVLQTELLKTHTKHDYKKR